MSADTLDQLLALHVTPANADDRSAVATLTEAVQGALNRAGISGG